MNYRLIRFAINYLLKRANKLINKMFFLLTYKNYKTGMLSKQFKFVDTSQLLCLKVYNKGVFFIIILIFNK